MSGWRVVRDRSCDRVDLAELSTMTLSVGAKIGPYQILALIGAGSMGEVYHAGDTKLKRDVALKVLPSAFSSDPDRVRRFEQEGRAAAALNHPNIVVLYDAGLRDGVYYIATELLEGESLRERLFSAALPVRKAIDYSIQIARGLAAAHAKGIVHRDLKPENLFVTKDGIVKILDFGLAKHQTPKSPAASPTQLATETIETDPGTVLGTVGYMSPEQVRGQIADARSDLFSLGVVLYEMVSGKRAFVGDSVVEVMNAILKQEPPELEGAVPPSLDRVIRRCLEKKPEERFQSASDLAFALESLSGTSERKTQPAPRRRYLRAAALIAGVCILVAAGWIAGLRMARPSSPTFQRVTYRRGVIDSGRLANGGRTIVYSASWDGNPYHVYSTQEESPEFRDLGIANGHVLAVSPGGEMALTFSPNLYFFSGTLARVPVSGGAPREIAEDISQADWTSDGSRMAVVRAKAGLQQLEFPIGHVLYKTTGGIVSPRISPQGDLIAFLDQPLAGGGAYSISSTGSLATVDMQGRKKTLSGYWRGYIGGLVWSQGGDEILFAAAPLGITGSLYAVNRSGRQRLVERVQGFFSVLDVAPDGRVLLARTAASASLFYQGPRASDATDLYWHDFSEIADVAHDGKTLLFAEGGDSARSGEDFISYIRHTDGSASVRLGRGYPLALSPDSKWAMVLGSTEAPSQLLLLPTGVGEARQLTHDRIHHQGAAWTPDGKRIVFVGNEPGHGIRYYVQNLDGGLPTAITAENVAFNLYDPLTISPDGGFVAVNNLDGRIALQPLDGGAPRFVTKLEDGSEPLRWCPDGRSLMLYHSADVSTKIMNVDVDTGKQTLWRELAPAYKSGLANIVGVRVGSDCQSYAYSALYASSDLWVARGLR
jgi:eukaryotic-like serine/threonine-protein kinase